MKQVKVYTTAMCPYCFTLKKFLKEKNVEFEEIDAASDEDIQNLIAEKTGKMTAPVIVIDDVWIQGFDRKRISELLDL